jgi:hypothetical protein
VSVASGPPVTNPVRVGGYALELGAETASFARFEPEREDDRARALEAALGEDVEGGTLIAAVEEFEEDAGAVTKRVERANELFRDAAEGRLLDPDVLTREIDTLLGVLGRLDREGRFEEELRVARALHGLLALSLRWLDLVRSLRSALRSAQMAGDQAGEAWARHELGSLHLCAGDPEGAEEHFREALRIEERLGDAAGRCATRHNLDSARRDLALRATRGGWRHRRLTRLAGWAIALVVAGGLGAVIALVIEGGSTEAVSTTDGRDTSETGTTSGTTGGTTGETDPAADTTNPAVTLDVPSDGAFVATATPELSGRAGTEPGDQPSVTVFIRDAAGGPAGGAPLEVPVEGGVWSVPPTVELPDGAYTASAQQRDNSGNEGTSATTAFTVDTEPPKLTLGCPSGIGSAPTCTLDSTEAGTAKVVVYEVIDAGGAESETLLESQPQPVELDENGTGSVVLELPEVFSPNFVAIHVVAIPTDAAGNDGQSDDERMFLPD